MSIYALLMLVALGMVLGALMTRLTNNANITYIASLTIVLVMQICSIWDQHKRMRDIEHKYTKRNE